MTTITKDELRKVSGGFNPDAGNWVHRGLDLSKPTELSPDEAEAFREHYSTQFGLSLDGLNWWFDHNPEVLKRYRLYCSLTLRVKPAVMGGGTLAFYMLNGYVPGVRYVMHSFLNDGLSKAQALEMIAIAFVHAGPRGMQALSEAMEGLEFPEDPDPPARFPDGWAVDLDDLLAVVGQEDSQPGAVAAGALQRPHPPAGHAPTAEGEQPPVAGRLRAVGLLVQDGADRVDGGSGQSVLVGVDADDAIDKPF